MTVQSGAGFDNLLQSGPMAVWFVKQKDLEEYFKDRLRRALRWTSPGC
jgi:hypothetical protein